MRIVRLSYIEGGVEIDRNTGQFEKAITNLPITTGAKLRTEADGRAEVELEDGSTVRLGSNTAVQFPQLSLRDSGVKASTIEVQNGTAYVEFSGAKGNELSVRFADQRIELTQAAHLRIICGQQGQSVAVFKGNIQVEGPSGTVQVKKNQTATLDPSANAPVIAKEVEPEPLDSWDKQQSQYQQRYASNSYDNYSPYRYGTSDLAYYGTFFNAPGYGMLWQPYFVGAGWDPFMDGAWAFTPGFGFGWVSGYPWGWVPYHYGSWVFLPGYGWAWQPGGVWRPWYSQPQLVRAPTGFRPPQPPTTIATRGTTIVGVNRGPASSPASRSGNKILIRTNSAGLGVPRGQVSDLAKVSRQVQERGTATQHVQTAPISRAPAPLAGGNSPRGMDSPRGRSQPASSSPRSSPPPSSPSPRMSSPDPSMGAPAPRTGSPHR
ncbi:MAG TPA: FecR family protein [Terriglobales bacterium]|nr:FecR family protein [Terriglobales bacterium]